MLTFNPILNTDSYKLSHYKMFPENVTGMFSYIEARTNGQDLMIPFGLQMWLKKYLTIQVTAEMIDEAETFSTGHGLPFNRKGWEKVINKYDGYMPVTIRAIPEGTPIRSGNALVTIECTDPDLFWLSSYLETQLLRAIWYPTTIATLDYTVKQEMKHYYEITGADMNMLPFALHDFGGRGVTSHEQAEIGGAAHLVNFMGADTVEGIRAANFYYSEEMSAFSVPATEHSVECSFGKNPEQELEYLRHTIGAFKKPGGIVSIVIDGYDVYRAAEQLCTTLKDEIIASGTKVVFRPDSGDMMETVPCILKLQASTFGYDINDKGFKKIRHVGIIQGDGVDRLSIVSMLGKLMTMGFSADNVIFGSGGALLQKVNRDTFKFAQKASAILIDGKWEPIFKDPITDPGKKSKSGRMTVVRSKMTGEISTGVLDYSKNDFDNMMMLVYKNGQLYNESTLTEIRDRVNFSGFL